MNEDIRWRNTTGSSCCLKDVQFERIQKECFWDYQITPGEIAEIVNSGSPREKKKLFEKIVYNSKDKLADLMLFSSSDLEMFFRDFVPAFNNRYVKKHIAVLKALLLHVHEGVPVAGLEWRKW
jgi:hypothetical protein